MVRTFWKIQVSFFFSRKINFESSNIFNVEEDVKVRYILEFNYTRCIYIYIFEYEFFDGSKECGSLQLVN